MFNGIKDRNCIFSDHKNITYFKTNVGKRASVKELDKIKQSRIDSIALACSESGLQET
jgi:hypothetical protein